MTLDPSSRYHGSRTANCESTGEVSGTFSREVMPDLGFAESISPDWMQQVFLVEKSRSVSESLEATWTWSSAAEYDHCALSNWSILRLYIMLEA